MSMFRFDTDVTPSLSASFFMASALCFHFFGYEMARAASIALLAAEDIGLGSGALSFTVAVGSPISAMVLFLYARSIKRNGPRVTLLVSNICCLLLLGFISVSCGSLKGFWGKSAVLLFYCFREIYVSLLSTQQWSFIASVLDSKTSNYLVTFAGVVSVASAVGGCSVEYLVSLGGVRALLITAFVSCGLSFLSAEVGTFLASSVNEDGKSRIHSGLSKFSQQSTKDIVAGTSLDTLKTSSKEGQSPTTSDSKKEANKGFWRKSLKLLMKHETLQLLFVEALIHQCCSNMLNMMFYDGLRTGIPLDSERAVLVGRFFASVNIAACFLQVFVMPSVLSVSTLPQVICSIPIVILVIVIGGYIYPSLLTVMFGFGALKVLEYSIMTSATEMIYMPMNSEQRYLGKELIRFFGHRMGKSAAVMILSAASAHFRPSLATQSLWSGVITAMWSAIMFLLSRHLALRNEIRPTKEESEGLLQADVPVLTTTVTKEKESVRKSGHAVSNTQEPSYLSSKTATTTATSSTESRESTTVPAAANASCDDTDTTSESESDGEMPVDSTDSLNAYYMPIEDQETDPHTQDKDGRTINITPSFTLLAALNGALEAGIDSDTAQHKVGEKGDGYIGGSGEEDYADFVVLDTNDSGCGEVAAEGRETNDTFLRIDPLCEVYEVEERMLQNEGLRRRAGSHHMRSDRATKRLHKRRDKKSSDALHEMGVVKAAISHKDLLSTIRRVHSTVKTGSKKYSDTWMSKINGTENGRPLMFRVGSTCMTMNNLVNENRERSTKNDDNKM